MKLITTGLNGTVAPWVGREAQSKGWKVVGWNRSAVDPADEAVALTFLRAETPDAIIHLAMGSEAWEGQLASFAKLHRAPMVYVSTATVFDATSGGPHRPTDQRTAKDDYGLYKIRCEDAVLIAYRAATVARIGWQIAPDAVGNNMLRHRDEQNARDGRIRASSAWRPACLFMSDTAVALSDLVQEGTAGPVHLDSNALDALTFDQLVQWLGKKYKRDWVVEVTQDYAHDQRLVNENGGSMVPPLSVHLA